MNEVRAATVQGRQHVGFHIQARADIGGGRVQFLFNVRRAGQVKAAQRAGTLVTIAGEGHVDKQAQPLANAAQLMREIENAPASQTVALLVHARDDLAVESPQQRFELCAQQGHIGTALPFAKAGTKHLVALFAAQLFKELGEAHEFVGLA